MNSNCWHVLSQNCKTLALVKRHHLIVVAVAIATTLLAGCEERERPDREYKSDPVELRQALEKVETRAELFEVLDLLAGTEELEPGQHPEIVASLEKILGGDDSITAAKAADILAKWGDLAAVPAMAKLLRDKNPWVRASAGSSLAIIQAPEAAAAVAAALKDADENVRAQAGWTLFEICKERKPDGRPLEQLRERLTDTAASVRAAAAAALGRCGNDQDLVALRAALQDENEGVVVQAAGALGRLQDREGLPLLTVLLESGQQPTQAAVAQALGRIRDPAAIDPLIKQLENEDTIVRGEAMRSLRDLNDPRVIPRILELSLDEDPLIQTFVPYLIGVLYTPDYADFLIGKLSHQRFEIRAGAAFALGVAQEKRALSALREATNDPRHNVRITAISALGLLADQASLGLIQNAIDNDPNPQARDAAKVALVLAKADAPSLIPRLMLCLRHESPEVQITAATLLTALDHKPAVPLLRMLLDDDDELIRNAAESGIDQLLDE